MSIIHTVFFWTGAAVWIVIIGIVIGIACLAVSQWWNRKGSISAGNILFGLFGPVFYRHFDCYKAWDRISHTPALHRDCLRRHNHFRSLQTPGMGSPQAKEQATAYSRRLLIRWERIKQALPVRCLPPSCVST